MRLQGVVLIILLAAGTVTAQTILFPRGGGTGTSSQPSDGDVLVGQSDGTYEPAATSTLGISTSPGGSDGDVQYNNGGAFGGFGDFNNGTNLLTLAGALTLPINSDLTINSGGSLILEDSGGDSPFITLNSNTDQWNIYNEDATGLRFDISTTGVEPVAIANSGSGTSQLLVGTTTPTVNSADKFILVGSANPVLKIAESNANSFLGFTHHGPTRSQVTSTNNDSGVSLIDFDPIVSDGSSASSFRFFRSVNTTGAVSFTVYKGDGTASAQHFFRGNGDSYMNADSGTLTIGSSTFGDSKLSVAGNLSVGSSYFNTAAPTDGAIFEGDVGIRTTNPQEALDVQGTASTTNAEIWGNLRFEGEIQPDGDTCSNGQILKKTGANDWDCSADNSGSGGGSGAWATSTDSGVEFIYPVATDSDWILGSDGTSTAKVHYDHDEQELKLGTGSGGKLRVSTSTETHQANIGGDITFTSFTAVGSATSSATNGINLSAGCFAIDGTCIGGGGSDTFASIEVDGSAQSTNAPTLDFSDSDFDLTESPTDDFDTTLDDSKKSVTCALDVPFPRDGMQVSFCGLDYAWTIASTTAQTKTDAGTVTFEVFQMPQFATSTSDGTQVFGTDLTADWDGVTKNSSFNDATVPAGNSLLFEVSSLTNIPDRLKVILNGHRD